MIQDPPVIVVRTDWTGIALVIGAVAAGISGIMNTVLTWKAKNKLTVIGEGVDGTKTELERQNTALKLEVVRVQDNDTTTPQQTAGEGGAPVGIDKGVVSVEKKIEP